MTDQPKPARRWDPIVKITHWSIALAVLANALLTEEGSGAHVWVGYALAAILALRLLWGFIGPAEARFAAFWPSPRKALAHLRDIRTGTVTHHASHNPLGALMVYAIWACLLTIIATGIAMAGPPSLNGHPSMKRCAAARRFLRRAMRKTVRKKVTKGTNAASPKARKALWARSMKLPPICSIC